MYVCLCIQMNYDFYMYELQGDNILNLTEKKILSGVQICFHSKFTQTVMKHCIIYS